VHIKCDLKETGMNEHDRPLFIETEPASTTNPPDGKHVVRLDASVLYAALHHAKSSPVPGALRLNLAPGFTVTLETEHIELAPSGSILWRGGMASAPDIRGSFAVSGLDSPTAGNIQLAGSVTVKGVSYRILPAGQNLVSITKCRPVSKVPFSPPIKDNSALIDVPSLVSAASAETEVSPLAVIHIKAFYPESILHKQPLLLEASFLPLLMYSMEVETNRVFANSKIPARVSIETLPLKTSTTDVTLRDLFGDVVGTPPYTPAMAAEVASVLADGTTDIVVLLAPYASRANGGYMVGVTGSLPRPPVSTHATVADRVLALALSIGDPTGGFDDFDPVAELTLAHELGHLLGAQHDRITHQTGPSLYDYVCGYVPPDKSFFTVMGYQSAAPHGVHAPLYSDYELTWNGQPAGIAPGQPGAASAATFLRWSAQEVSRYKSKGKWPGQQADWVALDLHVGDVAGPTDQVLLSMPGPYPKDTVVTVSALRERPKGDGILQFLYWELDGVHYSSALTIQITMDKPHTLKAHVRPKEGISSADIKVVLNPNAGKLVFDPPMPKDRYLYGTEVTVFYQNPPEGESYVPVAWTVDGTRKNDRYAMWTKLRIGSQPIHLAAELGLRKHRIAAHCVPADIGMLRNFGDEEVWRYGAADNEILHLKPVNALSLRIMEKFVSLAINGAGVQIPWDEYTYTVKRDTQIITRFQGHESVSPLDINFDPPEAEIEGLCGRVALRTKLGNVEGKVRTLKAETLLIRRDASIGIMTLVRGDLGFDDHQLDPPRKWELVAWSLGDGERQPPGAAGSYQFKLTPDDVSKLTLHFKKAGS